MTLIYSTTAEKLTHVKILESFYSLDYNYCLWILKVVTVKSSKHDKKAL
jgi:hypothetical protein